MRTLNFALTAAVLLASVGYVAACGDSPSEPGVPSEVQTLRTSLAPYSSLALAKNAGYSAAITDCMSNGDAGAMGIHWGNPALIDGVADPMHPEALIYEPGSNGEASLVGVEFIIPFSVLPKTAPAPELFGQKYSVNDVFQVWALHVWTHRSNPSGLFAPWNPRVHC
jgi:hypothetical protein